MQEVTNKSPVIKINDTEHKLHDLPLESQQHVARVARLRQEIANLQMQINERQLVLQAYNNAIVEAVKPVEDSETSQGLPEGFVDDVKSL